MKQITAYCRLTEDSCAVNGNIIQTLDASSGDHWFKQIYKARQIAYPKFHKMDLLSQAGFLGTELIKQASGGFPERYADDEIAVIFANSSSSADTDLRFIDSYQNQGSPSPSLFVYTLPNIAMGEIAISNKWYGENMFAVLPKFVPGFYLDQVQIMFAGGAKAALCGWLEVMKDRIDVLLFLVEQDRTGALEFKAEHISGLRKLPSTN